MDLAFGGYCNMALIEKSDMATLKSSAEVAEVAKSAKLILEEMSVASSINEAANTGNTEVYCTRNLSSVIKDKLVSLGYTIEAVPEAVPMQYCYLIKW